AQAGRDLALYRNTRDLYLDRHYYHPTNGSYLAAPRYLAPGADAPVWQQTLPRAAGRDAMVLLHPESDQEVAALTRIYPHATVDYLLAPRDSRPLMYTVFVPAADRNVRPGVHATLSNPALITGVTLDENLPGLSYDWGQAGARPGHLVVTTTLRVEHWEGFTYQWQSATGSPHAGGFLIDRMPVAPGVPLWLTTGLHSITVSDTVTTRAGLSQLLRTPVGGGVAKPLPSDALFDPREIEPQGLTALFRPGSEVSLAIPAHRLDPLVNFCFQATGTPLPRPYTAEWIGQLRIPQAGIYWLGTEQGGKSRLYIDDQLILTNRDTGILTGTSRSLLAGWHGLRLLMQDAGGPGASFMRLYWAPPGRPRSILPGAFLWPFQDSLPEDSAAHPNWPTLDQATGPPPQVCSGIP
ncbi:MAG: PA14 domain-containing protein, partial [Chloroflexota bacterium]|nr:PA14 domain-containing protein [Chloroflexota bacterium]